MRRRTFIASAGMAAAAIQMPSSLFARDADEEALAAVDPELRKLARQMLPYFKAQGELTLSSLPQQRQAATAYAKRPTSAIPFERKEIPGPSGSPPITIYVVNAAAGQNRPAILHTHGGGFIAGSAEAAIAPLQDLCRQLGCAAVTVEYRLAPETRYVGSIEDNYAGLKWLHDNAGALGVDRNRIAVMGESAGGGHAALLAIVARDRGEVPLAFQCLIYPMLDDRTGSTTKVPSTIGRFVWTPASNRFAWECFLGMKPGTARSPQAAVPARVMDLKGLPPTFIGVGSIDLFVNEDIDYAQRLNAAGVMTELIVVPGAFHGFDTLPFPSKVADRFNAQKISALRRGLGIAQS